MASETINQIAKALGEVDEGPLAQIAAVIEELGQETSLELLAETEKIEKSGGLMRGDGSGRRSPGGVFFFLARQKLPREVRARIFNDKMPRAAKPPGSVPTPPPPASSKSSGSGGPPPSTPGAPRRRVFEVVPASKPPHQQERGRYERSYERGFERGGGYDRDRDRDRERPSRSFEPRTPWPPKPAPGAYIPPELPSAVGRAKAKQAIMNALVGVNPADQYLVLLDLLAELHAQHGGEAPRSESAPASASAVPPSQRIGSQPPASVAPATQSPASLAAASQAPASQPPASQPPASQPPTSRSAASEPPPSSDRPAAKTTRTVKPRSTSKTTTAKARTRGA